MRHQSGLAVRTTPTRLLMLGILVATLGWGAQVQRIQPLRNRGQALFEEKRFVAAAGIFAQVAADPAATAQDFVNLALAYYESNDDASALKALDRAADLDASLPGVWYLRGLALRRQQDRQGAAESFRRAFALDSHDPAILFNLAGTLESLGQVQAARKLYGDVVAMGFDVALQHYVSSLYRYGFLLLRQRRQDEARPYLERYQQASRRLSQAQRAPAALEAGRYKRVVVPRMNLAAAANDARLALRDAEPVVVAQQDVLVLRTQGPPVLVVPGPEGRIVDAAGERPLVTPAGIAALGDADRDGIADLVVFGQGQTSLFRGRVQQDRYGLEPSVSEGLPAIPNVRAVTWVDADHDGDLDLAVAAGDGVHLVENRGGATFLETTEQAGLADGVPARAIAWADFDADSDVDLYVVHDRSPASLYTNLRGGRFEQIADAVGAAGPDNARAVVAEDLDNDGAVDLAIGTAKGLVVLRNDGDGTFRPLQLSGLAEPSIQRLIAADLNNDGLLDLVAGTSAGVLLWGNAGQGMWQPWARLPGRSLVGVADADDDGALDVLDESDGSVAWHRQSGPMRSWLTVRLQGIKNNILGIGARVEVKAGGLYLSRTMRTGWLHVGLGDAQRADVVRITWPNGIVQNEMDVPTDQLLGPVVEVERLEGSCPLLYTWDGTGWRFVNEVLGVAPLGMPLTADVIHPADFDEYVPVPGDALRATEGSLQIRLSEELRETGYLDSVRLLAVDHPEGTAVFPDEKFVAPPHPEFRLFLVDRRYPVQAVDSHGRDWSEQLARRDGSWAVPFEPVLYEGLATPHELELRLPAASRGGHPRLYLTGWVYWATASANVVVDQDPRVRFEPVSLEVPDGAGGWRTAIADIGLPNGKDSTLVVDLKGVLDPHDPRVRLHTTLRLYWDQAFFTLQEPAADGMTPRGQWRDRWGTPHVGPLPLFDLDTGDPVSQVRLNVLAPRSASIHFRGFSRVHRTADGFETFEYQTVVDTAPWNQHPGRYTRYGPVRDLLRQADDRYVIVGTGDEVAVAFDDALPELPAGWRRDWLVYLNGWVKDGDPSTRYGDRVEPLPFHAMGSYPYPRGVDYPSTEALEAWQRQYNTRPARQINLPLLSQRLPQVAAPRSRR